jgi:hypothetical protein
VDVGATGADSCSRERVSADSLSSASSLCSVAYRSADPRRPIDQRAWAGNLSTLRDTAPSRAP